MRLSSRHRHLALPTTFALAMAGLALVGCGPPTASEVLANVQQEPTAENIAALDKVLEDDSLSNAERAKAVRILVGAAKDSNDAVKKINRYLDKAGPAEAALAYELLREAWDGSEPTPPDLQVDRFLGLLVAPEIGMEVAEFVGKYTLLRTATAAKLFGMIFDSATRTEATAGMVAIGDVSAWAETEEAKEAIATAVHAASDKEVSEVIARLAATEPMVPAAAAIGAAIIGQLLSDGSIKDLPPEALAVMFTLLVKSADVGFAQQTFIDVTRASPDVSTDVAIAVLHEGVNNHQDVAGSVMVALLGSTEKADLALAGKALEVMRADAAPMVVHALLKSESLPMARTSAYIAKLRRWKTHTLTGNAKVLVTDSESEPQEKVEVLLCRVVVPPPAPPPEVMDMDEAGEEDGKEKKKTAKAEKIPEPEMKGCIKKPSTTDEEGTVLFEGIPIGIWFAVTKKPGEKWSTETITAKESGRVDPAWRCELAPEEGCEIGVVVR